jgi:hypothetical protein
MPFEGQPRRERVWPDRDLTENFRVKSLILDFLNNRSWHVSDIATLLKRTTALSIYRRFDPVISNFISIGLSLAVFKGAVVQLHEIRLR